MSFALTPTYEDNPRLRSLVERLRDYLDGELFVAVSDQHDAPASAGRGGACYQSNERRAELTDVMQRLFHERQIIVEGKSG